MVTINLLPKPRRIARLRRARARLWAAAFGLCLTGNAALFALPKPESARARDAVAAEISQARLDLEGLRKDRARLQSAANAAERRARAASILRDHPDWSSLLTLLAELRADDTVIESCEVERIVPQAPARAVNAGDNKPAPEPAENFKVRIVGHARSPSAAAAFVLRLERTGLFDQARLVDTRPGVLAGADASYFRVECSLGEQRRAADAGGDR